MGKIVQLDDQLSNKIAAGEVVERPSSVVKELVENAIDAQSTIIEVEIEEAGLSKIRVIDNGQGIEEDDCLRAFHRHATSKIRDENDLFRIRTLGFRGEALPSIASVSHLEMKTSTGEHAGTRLVIHGGVIQQHEKTSSRQGTDITVAHLFYNTPARLKYMKTIHTELGNITDVMNRLAMAHPSISFRLTHNGRKVLHTNGNGDLRQVMASIYGLAIAKKLLPIKKQSLDFEISGYISLPEVTRASRNYMSTIINGRFIKNYSIAKAIQHGYHTLLPIGRFPIVLLEINMDPILVDVNVHPSKLEVRLSKEQELNELIATSIKDIFKTQQLIPSIEQSVKEKEKKSKPEQQEILFQHKPVDAGKARSLDRGLEAIAEQSDYTEELEETEDIKYQSNHEKVQEKDMNDYVIDSFEKKGIQTFEGESDDAHGSDEEEIVDVCTERVPPLYPIGQMHGTYILAQNENGLYIIDQHAAQERIKYEYYREKVGEIKPELQELLVPITLTYSTDEYIQINYYKDELDKIGVFLEEFGHNSFIIRSHPQWFPKGDEQSIIEEIIEQVLTDKSSNVKKLREEAAIMMSCKASIKANRHLRNDEVFELLETLRRSSDPFTCPHGRPIIVHYSTYEMEKMFKRVM